MQLMRFWVMPIMILSGIAWGADPASLPSVQQFNDQVSKTLTPEAAPCATTAAPAHAPLIDGGGIPNETLKRGWMMLTFDVQGPLRDYECQVGYHSANSHLPQADAMTGPLVAEYRDAPGGPKQPDPETVIANTTSFEAVGMNRSMNFDCKKKLSETSFLDIKFSINQLGESNCWVDALACSKFIELFHGAILRKMDPFGREKYGDMTAARASISRPGGAGNSLTPGEVNWGSGSLAYSKLFHFVENHWVKLSAGGSLSVGMGNTWTDGVQVQGGAVGAVLMTLRIPGTQDSSISAQAGVGVLQVGDTDRSTALDTQVGLRSGKWTFSAGFSQQSQKPLLGGDRGWFYAYRSPDSSPVDWTRMSRTRDMMRGREVGYLSLGLEYQFSKCASVGAKVYEDVDLGHGIFSVGISPNAADFSNSIYLKGSTWECFMEKEAASP